MSEAEKEEVDEIEATEAPLVEHLTELRSRLMKTMIGFAIAFVVSFIFADHIYNILVQPYAWAKGNIEDVRLIAIKPQGIFFTQLKIGLFGALCLSFPLIASQLYAFVAPAFTGMSVPPFCRFSRQRRFCSSWAGRWSIS